MRPPHQGYAPETLQYQHKSLNKRYTPEGIRSGTWPALIYQNTQRGTLTDKDRHHRYTIIVSHTDRYLISSHTRRTANAYKEPNTETRKSSFRGGPRGGGRTQVPPPLSQIASDLRFAIRITNRNRSQIARFGALSPRQTKAVYALDREHP